MSSSTYTGLSSAAKEPSVNNIKIRLLVCKAAIPSLKLGIEKLAGKTGDAVGAKKKRLFSEHHNFIVFRNSYVFIIFYKGAVNITGIKRFEDISDAIETFCESFCIDQQQITKHTVDNVSASGDFGHEVNLYKLKKQINGQEDVANLFSSVSFNPNYFPAAFCKTYSVGTILVFGGGKYNIVGAKCQQDVEKIYREMLVSINKL